MLPRLAIFSGGTRTKNLKENASGAGWGRVLENRRLYRGDLMRTRKDCLALLASIDKVPLSVNEIAVAFENSGRSIDSFPVTLYHVRRQRLVREDGAGLLTLTLKGRNTLTRFRS